MPGSKPRNRPRGRVVLVAAGLLVARSLSAWDNPPASDNPKTEREGIEFFESKIRPLLSAHCYECHSRKSAKLGGGLALDSRAGWVAGGEGGAVIVRGRPDESRLVQAVRWTDDDFRMPPKKKLGDAEIALLTQWVARGAPDPRTTADAPAEEPTSWEAVFRDRLKWWSLQPIGAPRPPAVQRTDWPRNEIDRFVLAALEARRLAPAAEADRLTLARRLTFALTGLPPRSADVARFAGDPSPAAYEHLVDELLQSPHFGEHWTRHWLDVVHYADTHGYEWDIPAKNGWLYRDYLIRAFNNDVPFRQLALEHVAGDLLDAPRVDPRTGINESLIGPMALRLGERRHGDNSEFDGITQEAIDNVIDTVGKTFLGTTVACAHCHDHKLDALSQRDYYAWAGVFMSSRWVTRSVNATDPNQRPIAELRRLKAEIRPMLARVWLTSSDRLAQSIEPVLVGAAPAGSKPAASKSGSADSHSAKRAGSESASLESAIGAATLPPEDPASVLKRLRDGLRAGEDAAAIWTRLANDYARLAEDRKAANRKGLRLLADFATGRIPEGWSVDGLGMRNGFARDGAFAVMDEGPTVVRHVLPAGLYSHLDSPRLEGAVRSPLFTDGTAILSLGVTGGGIASARPIVDHALFPEYAVYLDHRWPTWIVAGTRVSPATRRRRIYFELVTKGLNNNFPARVGLIKATPEALADPCSWFGITRVYAGGPRQDELGRFARLFIGAHPRTAAEAARRVAQWLRTPLERWRDDQADAEDVALIDWLLERRLIANEAGADRALDSAVARFRAVQAQIRPDVVVGSIADLREGRDERIGIRGSYDELGDPSPRGNIRFLKTAASRPLGAQSGRLELARSLASPDNSLVARVYVNRVWHALFGEGLVRSLDDFGHLGDKPTHPELLDWLARGFIDDGWSTKRLIRRIVLSATWRQSGLALPDARVADPENRLWHHFPLRRLTAEEIRDAILAVSGRLDSASFGPPIDPFRHSEDDMKRLVSGPVDGLGRRSLYIKVTLMEPPRFLAEFNQPLPKLTSGRRDVTNVPSQALTLLNDPFVIQLAAQWARQVERDGAPTVGRRLNDMLERALGRPVRGAERDQFEAFVTRVARIRGVDPDHVLQSLPVWQDVAHAIFNLKEFVYVR